jgi:hypothetical protein
MTNHLKTCWKAHALKAPGKTAQRWFHLIVEGQYSPDYWLHLQAPAKRTFDDLDSLLRRLWLECCDHLSEFNFPVKRAPRRRGAALDVGGLLEALNRAAQEPMWADDASGDELMDDSLGNKLQPGVMFFHEYDFGSTTKLVLRVAAEHTAPAMKGDFKLLARNDPPNVPCSVCGKPATQICMECDPGEGDLCDACAGQHECGSDRLVPLINSPRTGVCGYCGPSVEP